LAGFHADDSVENSKSKSDEFSGDIRIQLEGETLFKLALLGRINMTTMSIQALELLFR